MRICAFTKNSYKRHDTWLAAVFITLCLLSGCGSNLQVGSKLYDREGELWGTVVEVSDSHTFDNGKIEPGVKVDYGPRMGNHQCRLNGYPADLPSALKLNNPCHPSV